MSSKYSVISLDDDGDENEGIMLTSLNSNVHKSKIPTIVQNNTSWGKGINSNIISMVLFSWYDEIIAIGKNRTLLDDDLLDLPNDMEGKRIYENFERLWTIEELKANNKHNVKLLWNSLHSLIFTEFWFAGFCRFINDSCVIFGALLLKLIINSAENHEILATFMFAILITLNSITQSIFLQQFVHGVFMSGSKVVSATTSAVFHSTLSIRMHRLQPSRTLGEINNVQSKDASSLREFVVFAHNLWACPLMIVYCIVLLYYFIGFACVVTVLLLVLLLPLESMISKKAKERKKLVSKSSDKRMAVVNEMVDGIKTVKFTNLFDFVFNRICQLRAEELRYLWEYLSIDLVNTVITRSATLIITLITFLVYILINRGGNLSTANAFAALAVINTLGRPLQLIPKCISLYAEAVVSCNRIEDIILDGKKYNKSLLLYKYNHNNDEETEPKSNEAVKIQLNNITVTRGNTSVLRNINLKLQQPGLVLLIGDNASGKSSLLLTILNELNSNVAQSGGNIFISPRHTRTAYCGHDSWIMNATVKENIIVASDNVNTSKYNDTVRSTALLHDINEWKEKDFTLLGEKGINISGGQRARIALARAVYADTDVYLLDNILAALDIIVSNDVFQNVIIPLSQTKLVILACNSNASAWLPYSTSVVKLQNGEVVYDGEPDTMIQSEHVMSNQESSNDAILVTCGGKKHDNDVSEKTSTYATYIDYMKACGYINLLLAIVCTLCSYGTSTYSDYLLSYWTAGVLTTSQYLSWYTIVAIIVILFNTGRYLLYILGGITASKNLHSRLLKSILGATITFFNAVPSGRITSRFSSDFNQIDNTIPSTIASFVDAVLGIVTGVLVVIINAPYYVIVIAPLTYQYLKVQKQYRNISVVLKRMENGSKSPLFSYFREVVDGGVCIRGYQIEDKITNKYYQLLDKSIQTRVNWDLANRWMGIRLDLIGSIIVSSAAFAVVLSSNSSGSTAGLMLSYALKATQSLTFAIRASTALENCFTSCDRVKEYIDIEQEVNLSESAPAVGFDGNTPHLIAANNIRFRYAAGLPLSINNISFHINKGELIGLCGRTGSGKSTISYILARAMAVEAGSTVTLRGNDIYSLPLLEYRKDVQSFPQNSYIFSGTIRSYLDPYKSHSDVKMNNVLQELHQALRNEDSGRINLDFTINSGCDNLSAGEKQTLALAKAALSTASIVILDEITSEMDETVSLQAMNILKRELIGEGKAVLLISHRINDLMICDNIWLLQDGKIIEQGNPHTLKTKVDSLFATMANGY